MLKSLGPPLRFRILGRATRGVNLSSILSRIELSKGKVHACESVITKENYVLKTLFTSIEDPGKSFSRLAVCVPRGWGQVRVESMSR